MLVHPQFDPVAFQVGPLAVRFLVTGDNSNGSVAAFELTAPAAQRLAAPAHSHDHYEETICGIEGILTWTVDGKSLDVGPGQALCIPRGAVHRFDNQGTQAFVAPSEGFGSDWVLIVDDASKSYRPPVRKAR